MFNNFNIKEKNMSWSEVLASISELNSTNESRLVKNYEWTNYNRILEILRVITKTNNEMIFPTAFGIDLNFVKSGLREPRTVEFLEEESLLYLIRPEKLSFVNPGKSANDSIFILNASKLKPLGVNKDAEPDRRRETVTQTAQGEYQDRSVYEEIEHDERQRIESGLRLVRRYLYGSFGIISKESSHYKSEWIMDLTSPEFWPNSKILNEYRFFELIRPLVIY